MTAGRVLWVWLLSCLIAAVAAFALNENVPRLEDRWLEGIDTPVVVLGSSLIHFGISPSSDGSKFSLTGDGRGHTRRGIAALTERESLDLVRAAIGPGVETILLEANTFIVDLQHIHQARQTMVKGDAAPLVFEFSRSVRTGAQTLIGRGRSPDPRFIGELQGLEHKFILDPAKLEKDYPLVVHPPRHLEEMQALISSARQQGINIILLAPPRPQITQSLLEPHVVGTINEQAKDLALALEVPVFSPGPIWPNSLFIDHSHLNNRGRQRFMSELSAWMVRRQ